VSIENLGPILSEKCRLPPDSKLILGFSGGPDSLALLHALSNERLNLIAAHLDHGIREDSATDAKDAEALAADLGIPFLTKRKDVPLHADRHSMSIEEAAREVRYEFLFRVAAQKNADGVAVAHNADDQVETVLMHLLRGSGSAGLRGMTWRSSPNPWSTTIPLIRPFLCTWRTEIMDYIQSNGLQPLHDESNMDSTYFRNRLRNELLPRLDEVAPGIRTRLLQTAALLAAESEFLEIQAEHAWKRCLSLSVEGCFQLDRSAFLDEPLALQRLLLRRAAIQLLPGVRDLDFESVQLALSIARQGGTSPVDWFAGLCIFVEEEKIWIAGWEVDLPVEWPQIENPVHLEIPINITVGNRWSFQFEEKKPANVYTNTDGYQAWLDYDRVGDELVLRSRKPGDRFQPLGMEDGSQKLSDFMINHRMPKRAREKWPLLCKGDEIIWVPGYQLAHSYRLRDDTARSLHVSLVRKNGSQ
jgi:tRNA(Ile)-lysidine synthase